MSRTLLHIGTHKTGSTSIQQFLRDEVGAPAFPFGLIEPHNHLEMHPLVMRPDRLAAAPQASPAGPSEAWQSKARAHIRATVESSLPTVVFSSESLSWLRYDDELERLRALLAPRDVHVVMFFRDPSAYLEAYWATMRQLGWKKSTDPDSIANVEPDSWLVDYDGRVALWRRHFGVVTVVDYDAVSASDGSVIPTFAALLGLDPPSRDYRLRTREAQREVMRAALRAQQAARD